MIKHLMRGKTRTAALGCRSELKLEYSGDELTFVDVDASKIVKKGSHCGRPGI